MKKILALLLAAVLLCTLAACGGEKAPDAPKPEPTAVVDEGEYHGELPFVKEGDELVTLNIGIITNANVTDYKDNAYTRWLEEQTGLNLEFTQFPDSKTAGTQVALMIASNERLPDILLRIPAISKQQGEQYGQDGYFAPLTEYFEKYAYYIRQSFDECYDGDPEPYKLTLHRCAGADNQPIYVFPFVRREALSDPRLQGWINQEWLDKLGLKMPETIDELYDVLVAFRDRDPNGNGKKDEIPIIGKATDSYSPTDPLNWIINAYIYYQNNVHFIAEGREITAPYHTDEYRQALCFINKLYREGLITQLTWTQTGSELKGICNPTGDDPCVAGVIFNYPDDVFTEGSDALRSYTPLKPLKAQTPRGGYAVFSYDRPMTTFITADCARPDLAFKLLDFMCSSDAFLRQRFGEFGVDWEWAEPGKTGNRGGEAKIRLLNPNVFNEQNAQCWHMFACVAAEMDWQYEVDFSDPDDWETMKVIKNNELYENSANAPQPEEVFDFAIYSLSDYEERSDFAREISSYVYNRRSEFCTDMLDPNDDAQWQTYLDGLQALHYDRWIELAQISYDRLFE